MLLKIFRALWFLSVIALFVVLLYGYAGWQQNMIVQDKASGQISIDREILFYTLVALFLLVNVLVYLIAKVFARDNNFSAWFHGLIITINIFFIMAMNFIGLYNSFESYNYGRVGFIIYGSIGLMITWAFTWPIYLLYRKFYIKPEV